MDLESQNLRSIATSDADHAVTPTVVVILYHSPRRINFFYEGEDKMSEMSAQDQ